MVKYSIIIPIYNEEKSIEILYHALKKVLEEMSGPYEIIFINDGSQDNTYGVLKMLSSRSNSLVVANLRKHSGKSAALQAGFDIASGEILITMDGDLQNDSRDIPRLIKKMEEGYDVVCGWRYVRFDPLLKILASRLANFIRRLVFDENIHDVGCAFRIYSKNSLKCIRLYRERHRYLTVLLKRKGFKLDEVKIRHHPRLFGRSKYGITRRLFSSIPDFLTILIEGYHNGNFKK